MAVGAAASSGIGTGVKTLKKWAGAAKAAAGSEVGQDVIQRAASSAVIGGAVGGGLNAIRGEDAWEGAKRGAVMVGVGSLGKSAYGHHQSGGFDEMANKLRGKVSRPNKPTMPGQRASGGQTPFVSRQVQSLQKLGQTSAMSSQVASRG